MCGKKKVGVGAYPKTKSKKKEQKKKVPFMYITLQKLKLFMTQLSTKI